MASDARARSHSHPFFSAFNALQASAMTSRAAQTRTMQWLIVLTGPAMPARPCNAHPIRACRVNSPPFVRVERIRQRAVQLRDRQPVVGTCEYGLQSETRASNRLHDSHRVISLTGLVIRARHCPNDRAGVICRSNLGLRDSFNSTSGSLCRPQSYCTS